MVASTATRVSSTIMEHKRHAPPPPSPHDDVVRQVTPKDWGLVKQLIGQGFMEGLAHANQRVYVHPLVLVPVLAIGFALSYILGYSVSYSSPLTWARVLVGPAVTMLPVLATVEYLHRPKFEARLRLLLSASDLARPETFYSTQQQAATGAWVFEHKGTVVGAVALDAATPGLALTSLLHDDADGDDNMTATASEKTGNHGHGPTPLQQPQGSAPPVLDVPGTGGVSSGVNAVSGVETTTPRAHAASTTPALSGLRQRKGLATATVTDSSGIGGVAEIRHITVDAPVRRHRIGTELLATALDHAFASDIKQVIVLTQPFTPGGNRVFKRAGFTPLATVPGPRTGSGLGLFGWNGIWLGVDAETWRLTRETLYGKR